MLVVKLKNKLIKGFAESNFEIDEKSLFVNDSSNTGNIKLWDIESITVDGVEIYRCPKEL